MSALFVKPLPFTLAGTSTVVAGSVANLNNDEPGMAWRSGLTSPYVIVDLGPTVPAYNYVALFGANLRASDTVRITTGTTNTGTGGYAGAALPAFTGSKDETTTTKAIFKLPASRTDRFVRIELSAPSHPDNFVQFTRLVIGSAIVTDGIAYDAEQGFETQSIITTGPGYRSKDELPSLDSWKLSTGWINNDSWRNQWMPMLRYASRGNGLLFIPDDTNPAYYQSDALYGFVSGNSVGGKAQAWNVWRFEGKLISYGA